MAGQIDKSGPGFLADVRPLGAPAGPWSVGTGSGFKNTAGRIKNEPRRPILRSVRWYFVFWRRRLKGKNINRDVRPKTKTKKHKSEAPQGHPSWDGSPGLALPHNGRRPTMSGSSCLCSPVPLLPGFRKRGGGNMRGIHGPKPYKFIGFGDIHGPKPYKCIGFGTLWGVHPT